MTDLFYFQTTSNHVETGCKTLHSKSNMDAILVHPKYANFSRFCRYTAIYLRQTVHFRGNQRWDQDIKSQ